MILALSDMHDYLFTSSEEIYHADYGDSRVLSIFASPTFGHHRVLAFLDGSEYHGGLAFHLGYLVADLTDDVIAQLMSAILSSTRLEIDGADALNPLLTSSIHGVYAVFRDGISTFLVSPVLGQWLHWRHTMRNPADFRWTTFTGCALSPHDGAIVAAHAADFFPLYAAFTHRTSDMQRRRKPLFDSTTIKPDPPIVYALSNAYNTDEKHLIDDLGGVAEELTVHGNPRTFRAVRHGGLTIFSLDPKGKAQWATEMSVDELRTWFSETAAAMTCEEIDWEAFNAVDPLARRRRKIRFGRWSAQRISDTTIRVRPPTGFPATISAPADRITDALKAFAIAH